MKKIFVLLIIIFIFSSIGKNQTIYRSENGDNVPTKGIYRILQIYVNVHYDLTPHHDPYFDGFGEDSVPVFKTNPWWEPSDVCGINKSFPTYADSVFDLNYTPGSYTGILTRFFAEASFDSLILLADYMSVDIPQSYISDDSIYSIYQSDFQDKLLQYIDDSGGVQMINGYNNISYYDALTLNSTQGILKPSTPNNEIDFVSIWFRNPCNKEEFVFGGITDIAGNGNLSDHGPLIINSNSYDIEWGNFVGSKGYLTKNIIDPCFVHEFGHSLLGGNAWHTSGGNHRANGVVHTFLHYQIGYGLMGWIGSALVCVNGYERWRLGWDSPYGNGYAIQANGINSDINKTQGPKSFILRDFIRYGDVVRIKLPYVDPGAANQYIWLENHRVGLNNKYDFLTKNYLGCRDYGTPGIYAYYQVGRDILDSTSRPAVFPQYMADNLKMITAEGFWDMQKGPKNVPECINYDSIPEIQYWLENSLNGAQDLMLHFFNDETDSIDEYKPYVLPSYLVRKEDNSLNKNLPSRGENVDAFTGTSVMDISSNPTPINTVTYYCRRIDTATIVQATNYSAEDTRKSYLTGLEIKMQDQGNGTFRVDVKWNNYTVDNDVRWTGDIVLKDNLFLESGKTMELVQNRTPNQILRDQVTGEFAGPTYFTCEDGSFLKLNSNSYMNLTEKSTLVLEDDSYLQVNDGAVLTVNEGCGLIIKSGAAILVSGKGRIEIEPGAYICIESGTDINIYDTLSAINIYPGAYSGTNPQTARDQVTCIDLEDVTHSGNGCLCLFEDYETLQNETLNHKKKYYCVDDMDIGYDVVSGATYGAVIIENNSQVEINAEGNVYIKNNFTVEDSEFTIH